MTYFDYKPCNVNRSGCESPPALADSECEHECFACGHYVCGQCSALMQYRGYGRQRICFNCVVEHSGNPQWAEEKIRRYLEAREKLARPSTWNVEWT